MSEKPHPLFDGADARMIGLVIGSRGLAAWEIASVCLSFLIASWIVFPFSERPKLVSAVPVGLAFMVIIASHLARQETFREIGFRLDNAREAVHYALPAMLGASAVILFLGWHEGSLRFNITYLKLRYLWLPVWGVAQQYVMQGFINRRAQIIFGRGISSVLFVGVLFSLFHMPNVWLSLATLLGGLLWAAIYQRAPNLFVIGLSHGIMAFVLVSALPASILHGLRVGYKYFGYN